jgi:hypothetical protein
MLTVAEEKEKVAEILEPVKESESDRKEDMAIEVTQIEKGAYNDKWLHSIVLLNYLFRTGIAKRSCCKLFQMPRAHRKDPPRGVWAWSCAH